MLAPGFAALLLLFEPGENAIESIAAITAERDVGQVTVARVLAYPALGHREHLGELGGSNEPVVHAALLRGCGIVRTVVARSDATLASYIAASTRTIASRSPKSLGSPEAFFFEL
jgi:hypothetical protein